METMRETNKEVTGPQMSPPIVMMTSLGSYFRKSTIGMRKNVTAAKESATSIAIIVSLRVLVFIDKSSFSHPDFTVGFGIAPNQSYQRFADFTAGRELHPALKGLQYLVANNILA